MSYEDVDRDEARNEQASTTEVVLGKSKQNERGIPVPPAFSSCEDCRAGGGHHGIRPLRKPNMLAIAGGSIRTMVLVVGARYPRTLEMANFNRNPIVWGAILVHFALFAFVGVKGMIFGAREVLVMSATSPYGDSAAGFQGAGYAMGGLAISYVFSLGIIPLFVSAVGALIGLMVGHTGKRGSGSSEPKA